jgi:hypothetical protein
LNLTGSTPLFFGIGDPLTLATTTVMAKLPEEEERASLRLVLLLGDGGLLVGNIKNKNFTEGDQCLY